MLNQDKGGVAHLSITLVHPDFITSTNWGTITFIAESQLSRTSKPRHQITRLQKNLRKFLMGMDLKIH